MKIKSAYLDFTDFSLTVRFDTTEAVQTAYKQIVETATSINTTSEKNILDAELIHLIKADRFIDAIRRYREVTGQYLKESKDYCQALKDSL